MASDEVKTAQTMIETAENDDQAWLVITDVGNSVEIRGSCNPSLFAMLVYHLLMTGAGMEKTGCPACDGAVAAMADGLVALTEAAEKNGVRSHGSRH